MPFRLGKTPPASPDALLFGVQLHSNFIGGLVALPDGKTLVTSSEDARIVVFDAEKRETIRELIGHDSAVNHLALSPDGKRLASASDDRTVRLWDTASWKVTAVCNGHEDYVSRVAITPHGKIVSTSKDTTCRVWDMKGRELVVYRGHAGWILAIGLVPDRPEAVTVSDDGAIKRWNIDLGEDLPVPFEEAEPQAALKIPGFDLYVGRHNTSGVGHEGYAHDLKITADGKWMISVEKAILVHDMESGAQRAFHGGHPWTLNRVLLSKDGRRVFTAADSVKAWGFEDGRELAHFPAQADEFDSLALDPQEKRIYAGSHTGILFGWELAKGLEGGPAKRHTRRVDAIAFSPDGSAVITGAGDGKAGVWDVATGAARGFATHGGPFVGVVAFAPDGRTAISGSHDGDVFVLDAANADAFRKMKRDGYWMSAAAITPDGETLVAGAIGEALTAWNLREGGEPVEFEGATKQIGQLELFHDGARALTCCYLGEDTPAPLQIWDVRRRALVRNMLPERGYYGRFTLLQGGRLAAAGTNGGVLDVWDLEKGERLRSWRAHPGYVGGVCDLGGGKIGTWMREVPEGNDWRNAAPLRFKVWDVGTGREERVLTVPDIRSMRELVPIDGGSRALLIIEDQLRIWNLETGEFDAVLAEVARASCFALTRDGKQFAVGSETGDVRFGVIT